MADKLCSRCWVPWNGIGPICNACRTIDSINKSTPLPAPPVVFEEPEIPVKKGYFDDITYVHRDPATLPTNIAGKPPESDLGVTLIGIFAIVLAAAVLWYLIIKPMWYFVTWALI